jgi:hypothetical protein
MNGHAALENIAEMFEQSAERLVDLEGRSLGRIV